MRIREDEDELVWVKIKDGENYIVKSSYLSLQDVNPQDSLCGGPRSGR